MVCLLGASYFHVIDLNGISIRYELFVWTSIKNSSYGIVEMKLERNQEWHLKIFSIQYSRELHTQFLFHFNDTTSFIVFILSLVIRNRRMKNGIKMLCFKRVNESKKTTKKRAYYSFFYSYSPRYVSRRWTFGRVNSFSWFRRSFERRRNQISYIVFFFRRRSKQREPRLMISGYKST